MDNGRDAHPLLTLAVILVALGARGGSLPTPQDVQTFVRPSVPSVVAIAPADWRHSLAGHYEPATSLSNPRIPALSGDDLYLFPDKTYIYIEWSDILPETIYDKGIWTFDGQFIRLQSDRTVSAKKVQMRDAAFVPLTATYAKKTRLLLMGVPGDFRYFKQTSMKERDQADFIFLVNVRARCKTIRDRKST